MSSFTEKSIGTVVVAKSTASCTPCYNMSLYFTTDRRLMLPHIERNLCKRALIIQHLLNHYALLNRKVLPTHLVPPFSGMQLNKNNKKALCIQKPA